MSESNFVVLSVTLYKVLALLVGFACMYFGYRLFSSGAYKKAGDLSSKWGDKNLVVKQAAPGTFFALFGVIVISIVLLKGLSFEVEGHSLDAPEEPVKQSQDTGAQVLPEVKASPPEVQAPSKPTPPSKDTASKIENKSTKKNASKPAPMRYTKFKVVADANKRKVTVGRNCTIMAKRKFVRVVRGTNAKIKRSSRR